METTTRRMNNVSGVQLLACALRRAHAAYMRSSRFASA
jgi:hypothetical protein